MKLTARLVMLLVAGTLVLLAIDGMLSIRRQVALFEHDMRQDAVLLGTATRAVFLDVAASGDEERALQLIADINREEHTARVRWVPPDSAAEPAFGEAAPSEEAAPPPDDRVRSIWSKDRSGSTLLTAIPLRAADGRDFGTLEISEPRAILDDYVRASVWRRVVLTLSMLLISSAIVLYFGIRMVGRPLRELIDCTRRIGSGDLSASVALQGRSELDELGTALNTMASRLQDSAEKLKVETARRMAALENLRHADRLRTVGRLASGIAHELGTPLNVVSGRASMIESGGMSEGEIVENAAIIREQSERISKIVRQLLDFARRPRSDFMIVDLGRCASDVCSLLEPLAGKKRISLVVSGADQAARTKADPSQIEQVLTNLIVNAVQASPERTRVEVEVGRAHAVPPADHPGQAGTYAFVRVRDQGSGIAEENVQHLFDPFFTTKEVGDGTGLGLSIVYSIVQDHGGWIEIDSRLGEGSRFTVHLPEA